MEAGMNVTLADSPLSRIVAMLYGSSERFLRLGRPLDVHLSAGAA
jgi:hypothetical protein